MPSFEKFSLTNTHVTFLLIREKDKTTNDIEKIEIFNTKLLCIATPQQQFKVYYRQNVSLIFFTFHRNAFI